MKIILKNLKDTEKIAKNFIKQIQLSLDSNVAKPGALVVAMYGDLGSGKTTFVKFIAKIFGIKNTITSPTFVIEKIYPIKTYNLSKRLAFNRTNKQKNRNFDNLIHIDAYRLNSVEELKTLGWEEISKNPKNIIFIEWPKNIKDILPKNVREICFKFINENTREIETSDKTQSEKRKMQSNDDKTKNKTKCIFNFLLLFCIFSF